MLVTAGPTREAIDPVRYITNHSTGKMGYEVAAAAKRRGASVTLVSGPTSLKPPYGVTFVPVHTAQEMFDEVTSRASAQQMVVKCAAVADYRPATTAGDKIKKQDGEMQIALTRTRDILGWLGEHRVPGQVLCGFSMETRDMVENSAAKLEKKRVDMIVANNLKEAGAGFGTETNIVTILTKAGAEPLPIMGKDQVADEVLTRLLALRTGTGP